MKDGELGASGSVDVSGGENQQNSEGQSGGNDLTSKNNSVSYESYRKALDEKKRAQEESLKKEAIIKAYEEKQKEQEEKRLLKNQNFEKLLAVRDEDLKARDERIAKLEATIESKEKQLNDGLKLSAFVDALSGDLDPNYFQLVDLDQIDWDPETNRPNPVSLQSYATKFESAYPKVIEKRTGVGIPNDAAKGANGSALTMDEWRKLPAKEMAARMKDVVGYNK